MRGKKKCNKKGFMPLRNVISETKLCKYTYCINPKYGTIILSSRTFKSKENYYDYKTNDTYN